MLESYEVILPWILVCVREPVVFHSKEHQCYCLFAFQNVKLTVKPASPETSARSVKVGFTCTVESALKSALMGWKPTTTRWSAPVSVSPAHAHNGLILSGFLRGVGGQWRPRTARSVTAPGKGNLNLPWTCSASQGVFLSTANSWHFTKANLGCAPKHSPEAKSSSASGHMAHVIPPVWPTLR